MLFNKLEVSRCSNDYCINLYIDWFTRTNCTTGQSGRGGGVAEEVDNVDPVK